MQVLKVHKMYLRVNTFYGLSKLAQAFFGT